MSITATVPTTTTLPQSLPLVSVVIPCYNQARFLPEVIESVRAQTYPKIEILVIDDGSPDDTSAVAARYPGVRCIRQENRGLSAARNTGIQAARGEFIAFIDADDRFLPNGIAAGVACLQASPQAALAFGRYRTMGEDGEIYNYASELNQGEDMYDELLRVNCIAMVAAVIYRRTCFDTIGGFDPQLSPAADYDMYLRFARVYPFARHHEIVADYRVYDSSMSANYGVMLRATLLVLRKQWPYVKDHPRYAVAYREGHQIWWDYYGELLYWQIRLSLSDKQQALPNLRRLAYLLRWYPHGLPKHVSHSVLHTLRLTERQARQDANAALATSPEPPAERCSDVAKRSTKALEPL